MITALFVDRQSPAEVARRYGVHRSWVYRLKARYEAEGDGAAEPRSRRPRSSPAATPDAGGDYVYSTPMKQLRSCGIAYDPTVPQR